MVSRYDVAQFFVMNWPLLSWKGDDHAKGVYFNQKFGYLIERTYAVRIRHAEPAPSVFYIPNVDDTAEDEVVSEYPYMGLTKVTKNYHLLFSGDTLPEEGLDRVFSLEPHRSIILPAEPLANMVSLITNKRERDRAQVVITITGNYAETSLLDKKKEKPLVTERFEIGSEIECNGKTSEIFALVNANTLCHALNLFKCVGNIHISISHDRIKLTSVTSTPKVEAVISLPKSAINKERIFRD